VDSATLLYLKAIFKKFYCTDIVIVIVLGVTNQLIPQNITSQISSNPLLTLTDVCVHCSANELMHFQEENVKELAFVSCNSFGMLQKTNRTKNEIEDNRHFKTCITNFNKIRGIASKNMSKMTTSTPILCKIIITVKNKLNNMISSFKIFYPIYKLSNLFILMGFKQNGKLITNNVKLI